jgi:hypothetical protein
MKKLILIILLFLPFIGFSQLEIGDTLYMNGKVVYIYHLTDLSPNDSNFVAVNMGSYVDWVDLIGRIDNLDSLGIFATDIQAGEQSINTGTTSITFPGAFDSTDLDISVVPYVRRTSDNAVVDYVVDNISTTGFDVTVWEDACYIRYIASQKQPESNAFFETILHQSDTATIIIDTSQVRNLLPFVQLHSTGGSTPTSNSIKITYTGIPMRPLIFPISQNSMVVELDSGFSQKTLNGETGVYLNSFTYTESPAINNNNLLTFSLDDLVGCEGAFTFSNCSTITDFYAPKFTYCIGSLTVGSLTLCDSLNFDSLFFCGALSVTNMLNVVNLSLSRLYAVNGALSLTGLAVSEIILPNLSYIAGNLFFANFANLVKTELPSLITYTGTIAISQGFSNLAYIKLGEINTLKSILGSSITVSGQKLSQGSVDSTLALLASLDGTNGTTLFGTGKTVNIGGGTSASPTFTGSSVTQAGSSFVGTTTTCTVTWVGHGYTTGDLLTISGIATLTTANGTFSITVDSPDQFHYTKATGTGTGAGTATVIKAGSTTEGYYYKQLLQSRGATVTTN